MFTRQGSAEAYDRLASLTNAANHAARLGHDWLKVTRAIRDLAADLAINEPADSPLIVELLTYKEWFNKQGIETRTNAAKLQQDAYDLNERLQNGVYNDDKR